MWLYIRPVGWGGGGGGGVGGFGRTPPPVQASSACPSWFRLPKLVPPAKLGSTCRTHPTDIKFVSKMATLNVSNMRSNASQIWFCTIYVAAYLIHV